MRILSGKEVAAEVYKELTSDMEGFKTRFKKSPQLAVISVGDDPASKIYLKHKEKACSQVGIQFLRFELDKEKNQEELDSLITRLNTDRDVHGILVQLPVPTHFSVDKIINSIHPLKDVDGFHPENLGLLLAGRPRVKPCTPFGIMKMLEFYKIPVSGQTAVVVGRSNIVGKPMAQLLLAANATVISCHSKTKDLQIFTKQGHIVVVAAGKAEFVDGSYFQDHACVIDVGIHRVDGRVTGDVDFKSCQDKVAAISPVPGGVGLMTVAMLMRNTLDLARLQESQRLL